MSRPTLTDVEARVLYYALRGEWATVVGYREFTSAVEKLRQMGGGERCRDCTNLGTIKSHLGGKVCAEHKHDLDH